MESLSLEEKVLKALTATLEPEARQEAEDFLSQVQKIIGFAPALLSIVNADQVGMPVRQAGVIFLKNMVASYWDEKPSVTSKPSGEGLVFTIHEQDRHKIRQEIIPAIIRAPEVIRVQLAVCLQHILKFDFPGRWPTVIDEISHHLNAADGQSWMGALTSLYQLCKNFEYKKPDERKPLVETMKILLPVLYERLFHLFSDESQESVLIQKLILKIFYVLVQHSFSLELMPKEQFAQWMELCRKIIERPVPAHTLTIDEDERVNAVWWKCKKWAMHLLHRIFERYGSPGSVASEYNTFSDYYLKNFSGPTIETILQLLANKKNGEWVSPRVLHEALLYLNQGTKHAFSWKFLKGHMLGLIQNVIFPMMCHSDKDAELWNEDPEEYIRSKADVFEELLNPVHAAATFLVGSLKRKEILNSTVQLIVHVLVSPESTPTQKDGALHMVGVLAPDLLKKKLYKNQIESMLVAHVIPHLQSPEGFLRARACWTIREFSEADYKNPENLTKAMELIVGCLLSDSDLPVKFEAALALQMLISDQERVTKILEPHIRPIILELLKLISQTENDDLTSVMQKMIEEFMDQIIPIAVETAQGLANIFAQFLNSDDDAENKALAAMGVLNTLEAILDVMEEHKEIMVHLEGIVLNVIGTVLQHSVMDFYEEVLNLVYSLTCSQISQQMWEVYNLIVDMFKREGIDYFVEMMPPLHNYVTIDTAAFLAVPDRIESAYYMCKEVLTQDVGEDPEAHAAKLIEVIILQCRGKVDQYIRPFLELIVNRLGREIKTSELRTMCLQVLISALHYSPQLFFEVVQTLQPSNPAGFLDDFIKKWIDDTDCFLGVHDRKMCLLGLSILLGMPVRPAVVEQMSQEIIGSCILLFEGLQRAYESKAQRENKVSESDDGADENEDEGALDDEEDEVDIEGQDYLDELAKMDKDSGNDEDYEDDEDDDICDETDLESYETPLDLPECEFDEFITFKNTLAHLQAADPNWYNKLTGNLTQEQQEKLTKVFALADQRKAAADSKQIESAGGYQFAVQQVPVSFNFGGPAL